MIRIGITGHSNLSADTVPLVADAVRHTLIQRVHDFGNVVGVSCLARGADQVFARAVLDLGGALEVVLPAADYRDRKVKPDNRAEFDALCDAAAYVLTMNHTESNRQAYLDASDHVLSTVDSLIAVWDGEPSSGRGGTADVVDSARQNDLPTTVVWPGGAERV